MSLEQEVEQYKADQRICDIVDAMLKICVEKQVSVRDTLEALDRAIKTVNRSVRSACWNALLTCETTPNEAAIWHPEEVMAEINRRED